MAPPRMLLGALGASTFALLASAAGAATITYTDGACANFQVQQVNGNVSITCGAAPPPSSPTVPSCGILASPTSVPATGTPVQLSANCNPSYPTPTSYVWAGPGIAAGTATQGPTGPTVTGTPGQTYTLTPGAAGGAGTPSSVTLMDSTPAAGGFAGVCAGFTRTIYQKFNLSQSASLTLDTYSMPSGPMVKGSIAVMEFTTPPSGGGPDKDVLFSVVEFPGTAPFVGRSVFVSTTPCDLTQTPGQWSQSGSGEVSLWMTFGGPSSRGYAVMQPNTTYYVMVVNRAGRTLTETCTSSACDLRLEMPSKL